MKIKEITETEYKELENSPKVKSKELKGADGKFSRSHTFGTNGYTDEKRKAETQLLKEISQLKDEVIEVNLYDQYCTNPSRSCFCSGHI